MSAKCKSSNKYYPLLQNIYDNDLTDSKEQFKKFVDNYFLDSEIIYKEFNSGIDTNPTKTPISKVKQISSRSGIEVDTDTNKSQQYYLGGSEYNKMIDDFAKKIISLSVFNLDNESFIDANKMVGDSSLLNQGILTYKKSLLSIISKYINKPITITNNLSIKELEDIFNNTINEFKSVINNVTDYDANYYKAYNAFVILDTFEDLLKRLTPFVIVNPEYQASSEYSKLRYKYVGPSVNLYTGYSLNEYADINDNVSDLADILLKYIPEVNINGEIINNTSITLRGFNSVMNKLKNWAENSTDPIVQEELRKGTSRNMQILIEKYEYELDNNRGINREYVTYSRSKLNGIKRFIYNPNMSKDIQNIFTHLMEKTVMSSYVTYNQQFEKFHEGPFLEIKNLTERPVLLERLFINDVIKATSFYWKRNLDHLKNLLTKYNISLENINNNIINIDDATIIRNEDGTISVNGNIENFSQIIQDIAQLVIEPEFNTIASQVYPNQNLRDIQLYTPVLATIIFNVILEEENELHKKQGSNLARILNIIKGSDIASVIKNSENNNLPIYQLTSLAYRYREIYNEIEQQLEYDNINSPYYTNSPYYYNAIFRNIQYVKSPTIRSEVNVNGTSIPSHKLIVDDLLYITIGYDFFVNLMSDQSLSENDNSQLGVISIQPLCYSDKFRYFLPRFDLNKTWNFGNKISFNFKLLLDNYFQTKNKHDLDKILDTWFLINQYQINASVENIIADYNRATNNNFNSLSDIKSYLSIYNIEEIRKLFWDNNVEFIDEFHASKINGKWTVNETIENLYNIFNNKTKFNDFISNQFNLFVNDCKDALSKIKTDAKIIKIFQNINPQYVINNQLADVEPLLYAFFITTSFLSNEYNKMMVGEVYIHPNKNKEKSSSLDYLQHCWASRWTAQSKRMSIMGATYHSYAQGLKYGVPERVKMAVMPDIQANVQNIIGMHDKNDSMDGSGYTSPYLARWEKVSLLDAKVESVNKTIYHDIDAIHESPKLLKWAEYEITNDLRRNSYDISMENMYKKMHNFPFTNEEVINEYSQEFNDLYFKNNITGHYFKINKIIINKNVATRYITRVNKLGENISSSIEESAIIVDSIYKIDQLFGGAWAMELNPLTNDLQWTEKNQDYINKIICEYNLKDAMVGWLVNKSAIKVGASNINSEKAWTSTNNDLRYTTMSTKFGGLQMDANESLDEAEVTEMTQMISALEQNGFSHDIVTQIYNEIGEFCYNAISDIEDILYNGDKDKLYEIFGKAVIQAFQTGNKDTLGLAQSFIALAQKGFDDNKIEYRIPFSSSSINGIFNSTISSHITKETIRRHYNGVAAILNPSHNVMQYYTINGYNYRYEELQQVIQDIVNETEFAECDIDDFTNKIYIALTSDEKWHLNPFIENITLDNPIDFEDTIVIFNTKNDDGTYDKLGEKTNEQYEIVKIDNYEKYDYYKHYEPRLMMRWILKPKNLKGSDTTFFAKGRKYSMFESPYTKILYYLVNSDLAANDIDSLKDEIKIKVVNELKDITSNPNIINNVFTDRWNTIWNVLSRFLKNDKKISNVIPQVEKFCIQQQQEILHSLSNLKPIQFGNEIFTPEWYQVLPVQIAMGKLYTKELGLLPGDSIAEIKKQGVDFFQNRMLGYYINDNDDITTYDWILYDGTGNKLYVKLDLTNTYDWQERAYLNSNYKVIENRVYFDGKEICSAEGKKFIKYKDSDDQEHDIVIINNIDRFRELQNSNLFCLTERNYRLDNFKMLIQEQFSLDMPLELMMTENNIYIKKDINNITSDIEKVEALKQNQSYWFITKIQKLAEDKFNSFNKSLRFIGCRIPCQSQQSYAPMEVVIFTDSNINQVFVPVNIFWLEGSDLDIDKQYIMGYSISPNGYINTNRDFLDNKKDIPSYVQNDILRNRIVDDVFKVILNSKNQINLTVPVTTNRIKDLADKSELNNTSKLMNPYNPASSYLLQIENRIGKDTLGICAVGIKSFFALSYTYNKAFANIYDLIKNKQYDLAREMLNKYTFIYKGNRITLANVNIDWMENLSVYKMSEIKEIEDFYPDIPEDIRGILLDILTYVNNTEDQSMVLGEILNSAADNAKELRLKKINADSNWVSVYITSLMLGDDLETIGKLMLDKDITELLNNYDSSVFNSNRNINKIDYIKKVIYNTNGTEKSHKYEKLLELVIAGEELRILGSMLKINQGLPTSITDMFKYVKSIEKYIESRYNWDTLNNVQNALIELQNGIENDPGNIKQLSDNYKSLISIMNKNWQNFDLIKFITDNDYRKKQINKYEENKVFFNILEVISSVPHFREMFNVIAVNNQILNSLSVRNKMENVILNHAVYKSANGKDGIENKSKMITDKTIREIKDRIDEFLINSWIISKNFIINIPPNVNDNPAPQILRLNDVENIGKFKQYVEDYAIPLLKQKLPNNKFISLLTLGIKKAKNDAENDIIVYRLPFNMMQIDNTQKTRSIYEQALYAFNNLNTIKVDGIDINLVDLFYLYNLIVNKDKFGSISLTRIFEDLIMNENRKDLLVYDFNAWIDQQDADVLINQFLYSFDHINEQSNDKINSSNNNTNTSNDYYDTKPSVQSKLINLIKSINIPGIHITYDVDLVNEDNLVRNAKGFIRDGEIYINVDRATNDTVIHEFGHLYLADAKIEHPRKYYNLLKQVKNTDIWTKLRELPEYSNKRGSDFDEEVLATIITNFYKGMNIELGNPFFHRNIIEDHIALQAIALVSDEFKELLTNDDTLPTISDSLISNYSSLSNNYRLQQKLSTLKNKLIAENIIKENCQ